RKDRRPDGPTAHDLRPLFLHRAEPGRSRYRTFPVRGLRPRDGRLLALGHAGRGRRADRARRAGGQARTAGPPAAGTPEDRRRTAAAPARARREPGRDPGRAAAAGRRRAAMTRDEWLSAARLVELRLPALPSDKGALSRLIARE